MDPRPQGSPRVAYSFASGTFDLRAWCPGLWFAGDDGISTGVHLDGRWHPILTALGNLGTVLASVRSGPVCLASTLRAAAFESIPGTHEYVDLVSGAEIRRDKLWTLSAVIEEIAGQQIASLQFFSRDGAGCLKIIMTESTHLDAFEELVLAHAVAAPVAGAGESPNRHRPQSSGPAPDPEAVRRLWPGLSQSQPGRCFPGLAPTLRLTAFESAGADLAFRLLPTTERLLLEDLTRQQTPLAIKTKNNAVLLPISTSFARSSFCGCGQTFFGRQSQLTLRRCCGLWQAWAVRHPNTGDGEAAYSVEIYDDRRQFAAALSLPKQSTASARATWNARVEAGRVS